LIKKFKIENCNPNWTPTEVGLKISKYDKLVAVNKITHRQLVGSLIYLTITIPDINSAVGMLSRFLNCPRMVHWNVAKRVFRYIKGTLYFGVAFKISS